MRINGANRGDMSVWECKTHCETIASCIGFEYGVDHGGNTYHPGYCFPLDGGYDNIDSNCVANQNKNSDYYV